MADGIQLQMAKVDTEPMPVGWDAGHSRGNCFTADVLKIGAIIWHWQRLHILVLEAFFIC